MFKFSPTKWVSSLILSKFLKPYLKNFDHDNIDLAFWEGQVSLKNVQLRNDLLIEHGIQIEIVESFIGELSITIPWNNLKNKPIHVEISKVRIVLANKMDGKETNKQHFNEQTEKLKMELLQKFDEGIQKEDQFYNGTSNSNFIVDFAAKLLENFVLKVKNLDVVFIYQINNYEIVKLGLGCNQISVDHSQSNRGRRDDINKHIDVQSIFLLFEFYDSILPNQFQQDSFIQDQTFSRIDEQKKIHILKQLSLGIDIGINYHNVMEIDIKIMTSPILIYLKQRQIRLLIRASEDIVNHRSDRPKEYPLAGKFAKQWWQYAIKRVIERDCIRSKVRKQDITNYYWTQRYIQAYTKKMLKKDEDNDKQYMKNFELKNTVTQILILRSMSVDKILEMRSYLKSNNPQFSAQQKGAQQWFKYFNKEFNMEHASNLKFSKKIVEDHLSFVKDKEEEVSNTRISIIVDVPAVNILIQENKILQQLKNLHQQVNVFKQELMAKQSLQEKVLDHIKNNFLTKLSKVTVRSEDEAQEVDWTLEELTKDKLLINLQIQNTKVEYIQQGQYKKLIKGQLQNFTIFDMNKLNQHYNKIVHVPEGIKILMSSEQLKGQRKIMEFDPFEKTIQVHLDINIGPVNVTLCKPLFERILSLQSLIFFDANEINQMTVESQKYFDKFLITNKKVQSNINLSCIISKINIHLPLKYNLQSDMLLIHLKQIKIFKREHYNSMVNVFQEQNLDGQVNQYINQLKTKQAVERVANQSKALEDSQNLKPLYVSLDCLRVAFVESYDWEEKENLFLIQYRKLQGNEHVSGDPGIQTILETLPIKIRMEQVQQCFIIGEQKEFNFKKKIYPQHSKLSIQLPFLDVKLSIKHLYQIQQIAGIWSSKGYDFYDVIERHKTEVRNDLQINPALIPILQDYTISELSILMDGLQFQLIVNTNEFLVKNVGQSIPVHENRLFTFYFLDLVFENNVKFYQNIQNLGIQNLVLQNINCHKYEISDSLRELAVNLLSLDNSEDNNKTNNKFEDELVDAFDKQSEILDLNQNISQAQFQDRRKSMPEQQSECNISRQLFRKEPYIPEFWKNNNLCQECHNAQKHRLLLNFQKSSDYNSSQQPDIYFQQIVEHNEPEINVQLCQLNINLDPKIISQLRLIFDYGGITQDIQRKYFTKWMRVNGFWPDFNEVEEKKKTQTVIVNLTKELTEIKSKTTVTIASVCLLMHYEDQLVYLFNMKNVSVNIQNCALNTQININLRQARLFDTAIISGYHTTILEDYSEDEHNQIDIEIQVCQNEELIRIKKYQSYCGIRIKRAKIVFLKRITNEIQYYIRKVLLKSFGQNTNEDDVSYIWNNIKNQDIMYKSEQKPETQTNTSEFGFKFSLVALNSQAIAYRNSLSDDALYVRFDKVGFWMTGKWGMDYDSLIKTGCFDHELEQNVDELFFQEANPSDIDSEAFYTINDNQIQYQQIVNIWGLEIRSCDGSNEKDIFLKAQENQVALEVIIIFEDVDFPQAQKPMRINVNLPKAKIYAYDLDYCTIVKLFMENLGEQCQTIVGPYNYDETNENFWMVLDINIGDAIAKFFKGKRSDIEKLNINLHNSKVYDSKAYLYKNAASVAFAELGQLNFQFMMRENGGKLMKLSVKKLNLSDFRESSTLKHSKQVLFGLRPEQFNGEDETLQEAQGDVFDLNLSDIESLSDSDDELNQTHKNTEHEKQIPIVIANQNEPNEQQSELDGLQGLNNSKNQQIPPSKPTSRSKWESCKNFFQRLICCKRIRRRRGKNTKVKSDDQKLDDQGNNSMEDQKQLLSYPEEPTFKRRWLNYRLSQALPITIENQDEYQSMFGHLGDQDLLFIMRTRPDGEKLIKLKVEKKNVILLIDFLVETVQFFRTPFNGSDVWPYQKQPLFNNYPPMVVQVEVSNVWALILGDVVDVEKQSVAILLDVMYTQEWQGDSWIGPGVCEKNIDATLLKLYLFQTNHIITDNKSQDYFHIPNLRSLIEPFKLSISMKYSVDFWRKAIDPWFGCNTYKNEEFITAEGVPIKEYYKDYLKAKLPFQSKNQMVVRLINHNKLNNNFSLSIRDIAQLQQIFGQVMKPTSKSQELYTMTRKEPPSFEFVDDCINTKQIRIKSLKIQILKNKDGIKAAQFILQRLMIQDYADSIKSSSLLIATIQLDYFNKRKLDFEPFIEPWQFKISKVCKSEQPPENKSITRQATRIKLSNVIAKNIKGEEVPYYLKDHSNALNINVTSALVEVGLEALKIYNDQMQDEEPYKIFNKCGFSIMLKDVKKDILLFEIGENKHMLLNSQQELLNKESKKHKMEQQQMLLNLIILKRFNDQQEDKALEDLEDKPVSSPGQRKTYQNVMQAIGTKQNLTQSTIFSKTQPQPKVVRYAKSENSNFKQIKYVNFDFVGKKFYPLERQHKNENQDALKNKKNTIDVLRSNFDKLTDAFMLTNSKKINEDRNLYVQVGVNINPQNGSKEIHIQSTVKLYNYLNKVIEMGFLVNGQMAESLRVTVKPREIFVVPLEFLENKTEVRFTPTIQENDFFEEQLEYKYYQLDTLLCDQCPISDFEIDRENTVIEALVQAKEYVTPGEDRQPHSIIKSEFKSIQDPYYYKNDFVISSQKNNLQSKNFYFVINCVKVKNQITNQKNAYMTFAGISQHNKQQSEEDINQCYETFLILYPILQFTNAVVRDLEVSFGVQSLQQKESKELSGYSQTLKPEENFVCYGLDYSEEIALQFRFAGETLEQQRGIVQNTNEKTTAFKIFQKKLNFGENNAKFEIKMKQPGKSEYIYLFLVMNKRSQKARELVLYSPFLIFNETDKLLMYRECGFTKDIVSVDKTYYQHFYKGTSFKGKQKKDFEQHSYYHNLHIFSTSSNMNKLQVAIGNINDNNIEYKEPTVLTSWSKPVSLRNSNVLEIVGSSDVLKRDIDQSRNQQAEKKKKTVNKGKFEFGMKITNAPGILHRSKLITITPRFIVHNETSLPIAMAQVETEYVETNLLRVKPGDWKYYYWSNIKKPHLAMISFYQQSTGLIAGWSGFFKLQVQENALKIANPKSNSNQNENTQLFILQKVNITIIDDLLLLIRFVQEDSVIPPYYIENLTKYEISFKQQSAQSYKYKPYQSNSIPQQSEVNKGASQVICNPSQIIQRLNLQDMETMAFSSGGTITTLLQPGERVAFTWDNWIDDKEHVLEVEIEGQGESYEIDKIQNFRPILLPGQSSKKKFANKKYLYKQGKIMLKDLDQLKWQYCTLNVIKQKFNVYTLDKKSKESYTLQGAKVEESKDNEFLVRINPEKMLSTNLYFQTSTVEDASDWVDYLWRAILIDKPDMVELKIEPQNQTKVVSFYQNKSNEQNYKKKFGQKREDDQTLVNNSTLVAYKISISNCIGISIIDQTPKEIIQTCIKNIQAEYIVTEEILRDQGNKILMEDDENLDLRSQQGTFTINFQDKTYVKLIKESISLSIDLMIINNQLINSQFPVLLAPNKKKIFGDQQPFLMLTVFRKDQSVINKKSTNNTTFISTPQQPVVQQQQVNKSKISYIHTFSVWTDTLEIRLDHQILDQLIQYTNQIKQLIADSSMNDESSLQVTPFNFRSLQAKLEQELQKIYQHSISKIYLKNLMLEPIDICFTLKSSPGHTMNSTSNNMIGDLGLTLASIDSAKIKLNAFKTQHIFGSSNEIIGRISKHYQGQFLTQIYKLLGSFELFGSPVSLISNLGTGVIDMFYEPFYALVTGKSGYKAGEKFFTGAVSLIHTSITGVYKTVNKILGTIMKLLDQITLDKQYMSERSNRLNRTIRNYNEGIIIGFTNFGKILFLSIIGILERPIRGLKDDGLFGFILGIYQGIMGLIIKPTVGIYDLLITIIDGIKNSAVFEEHIMDTRYRPPRIFGDDNQLIPFDFIPAIGSDLIRRFKLKVIEGESILFFDQLDITKQGSKKKIEAQIVLTDIRIVYVLTHSSIHCDRIMVYKIKTIRYSAKTKQIIFKFHTPIRRNWYRANSTKYKLRYENEIKAQRLIDEMKLHFKDRHEIEFK